MRRPSRISTVLAAAVAAAGLALASPLAAQAAPTVHTGSAVYGAVYTETNAAAGNAIEAYTRGAGGQLTLTGSYPTDGLGTGTGLASQGAVALSADGQTLLAVDAGSNQVSDFAVTAPGKLVLRNVVSSDGTDPVSVAIHNRLVEVLNAGGTPNIWGFWSTPAGLISAPAMSAPLSSGAGSPRQVAISPSGRWVIVTEETSNTIDAFEVHPGWLGAAVTTTSPIAGPYGFAFAPDNRALVSDVGPGAGGSAVSNYAISHSGQLVAREPAVTDSQTAACWLTMNSRGFAFVSNAGSGSISTYRLFGGRHLAFLANTTVGGKPLDESATGMNGRLLFVLDGVNDQIDALRVGPGGFLTELGTTGGLPASVTGLATS